MKKIVALILMCVFVLSACNNNNSEERESVSKFTVASFEYMNDDGYKLVTSEIDSLHTFDSLLIKPSNSEFSGEWVYRIIFNPAKYAPNDTEFIILFGEHNLSVNGKTYEAEDGVEYSEILNWAAAKYKFFDYELIN